MVAFPESLTPKQEAAVAALLTEPTVARAAEKCGVGERTLYRWLSEEAFAAAYRSARREAFAVAIAASQRFAPAAVATLARVMGDPDTPAANRIAAAAQLLRFARESIELDDLAERIERLEARERREADADAPLRSRE